MTQVLLLQIHIILIYMNIRSIIHGNQSPSHEIVCLDRCCRYWNKREDETSLMLLSRVTNEGGGKRYNITVSRSWAVCSPPEAI